MKKLLDLKTITATAVLALAATGASAQPSDISELTGQLNGQMQSLAQLAGMVAFLTGFVFGIMGFMKLKANAANPNDPSNKVSTAFILIFIGAALIAVPTVMGIGVGSLFGDGDNNVSLEEGGGNFIQLE